MGGALAVKFAEQRPEKVNKLVLLAPAGLPGKRLFFFFLWIDVDIITFGHSVLTL